MLIRIRERKSWIALLALLLIFAACKGESPTTPPPGGGIPPGSTPPPTGATLTLVASNSDPLVDSTVTITATASLNNAPVPNGTAVEFTTNNGVFTDTGLPTTIRTTTNGVATATLSSSTVGPARITGVVNNISRTLDITFRARPVTPPPANTAPTITSISPTIGSPAGGQIIRIVGTNFRSPVKVLFDTGLPLPVEAVVVSVSSTLIEVITPPVNLAIGQQLEADIIVITEAGTTSEQRLTGGPFIFRNEVLTPRITTLSPASGPIGGGTRVTIFGDGFQSPVQVFFGSQEAQVVEADFAFIIVSSPDARSTSPDGSGTVTGPVDVRVVNINSNTETTLGGAFRYTAAMQITAAGPTEGPFTGGTRVTIDGIGFVAPVTVSIGGVAAQPIFVSGTRVIAITPAVAVENCGELTGPITVTNINNGDQASGPAFIFRVAPPVIVNVSPSTVTAGGTITITVANAQAGINRIQLGPRTVFPSSATFNPDGSATFSVIVPTNFTFPTEACTVGGVPGTRRIGIIVSVTYLNATTGCTDTATDALTIDPIDTSCGVPPPPEVTQTVPTPPSPPNCADAGPVSIVDPATGTATISFRNDGGQDLLINRGTITGTQFTVTPATLTITPGTTGSFTVTFNPSVVGADTQTVTFTTNDSDEGIITVCMSGTGTP